MDAGRGWTRLILFGSACQHVGHDLIKKKVYDTLRSTRGARRRFVCERPVCWHVFLSSPGVTSRVRCISVGPVVSPPQERSHAASADLLAHSG